MKKLIICLLAISISSCGQEKSNNITQKISQVYQEVKHRDEAIHYHADFHNSDCSFELLINDMLVYSYYDIGGIGSSFPINYNILKAGEQTYTIRLYPQRKQDGTFMDSLVKKTSFKLVVSGIRFKGGSTDILDEGFTFITPAKQGVNDEGAEDVPVFAGHGLPYAEYTGTFKAKVPYTMVGWSTSEDLTKEDPDKLLEEVINMYKEYGKTIINKDEEKLFSMLYIKQKEMSQAVYADSLSVQEDLEKYRVNFIRNELKIRALENYKLQFLGNGKVVALIRTDMKYRGEYALHASYRNKKGRKRLLIYNVELHRPKAGEPLEIIR